MAIFATLEEENDMLKLYKKYPNIIDALDTRAERYNKDVKELEELEKQGKVFVIAPRTTMGVGRTESDPEKLRALYEEGYRIGKERMAALREYLQSEPAAKID